MYREQNYPTKLHDRQAGFSLLELLAVVIILGIMAVALVPDSAPTNQQKLDIAVQEFAAAMRFARSEAIRLGEPRGFRQQSSPMRIRVFRADTGTVPWTPIYDVRHPLSKQLYGLDLNAHPMDSVDSIAHNRVYRGSCNQAGVVHFDGQGIPRCTDPETVLLEQFELTFTLGNHSRLLRLDGISGQVSLQ